jgi:SPP1 family predicted phage head-tail adaptor
MNPSKLDRRITIQAKTTALDVNGDRMDTWTNLYTNIAANVKPTGGREMVAEHRMFETSSAMFMTRYFSDVCQQHRILYNGKYYNITSVNEIGRHDGLLITAEASNNEDDASAKIPAQVPGA